MKQSSAADRHLRVVPADEGVAERPPKPALDDAEILSAMRRHDGSAAVAFHDRVRPQIERTVFRLLGRDDTDRDDLVQLSLIELVYSLHRYRGDCSLDSWTATVTAHVVWKQLRRRKLERRIFQEIPGIEELAAAPTNVSRTASARGALAGVRKHLESLGTDKAWTFVLHDVWGYDLREIAQIMEVTVAAAQRRLVRGRNELHVRIEADPDLAGYLDDLGDAP